MTFTDILTHPSKLFHSLSVSEHLNKKDRHSKFERLNTSILNLFPRNRQGNSCEKQNSNEQRNSLLHPPSTLTTSELSRSISNKSITFASIFDDSENENINKDDDHVTFDLGTSTENEDLIIIVPDKYVNNEPIVNKSPTTNTEPYPFRSELPSYSLPKSNSSANIISSCHSGKTLLHHLIHHHHRSKKLSHPVKTNQCTNTIDRSTSAPNLLFSSTAISNSPTMDVLTTTNHHHRSFKIFRGWFKSSSVGRYLRSFVKHSNNSNTKYFKQKSRFKSTTGKKYTDLIY